MLASNKECYTLIIGGCGSVGALFADFFGDTDSLNPSATDANSFKKVISIDLTPPTSDKRNIRHITLKSKHELTEQFINISSCVDTVVIALPEQTALEVLPDIFAHAAENTLIIDTLSVKQRVCDLARTHIAKPEIKNKNLEYLSLNPMFSPSMGFDGQSMVAVTIADGKNGKSVLKRFNQCNVHIKAMTDLEHDEGTALLQAATHLAIMSFGMTLSHYNYDVTKWIDVSPPPHKTMLLLMARMCTLHPEVYYDIQTSNSQAEEIRTQMSSAILSIQKYVEENDEQIFEEKLGEFSKVLGPELEELTQQCQSVFKLIS